MISENERWILSFYRTSEISGSLFFGRLAKSLKAGRIQHDMTRHYADEAMHAWYWTDCLNKLGVAPLELGNAYQDQYLAAAGMPVNIMEILAITQVFERRVINQYAVHGRAEGTHGLVKSTIERIVEDEKWHIKWIRDALKNMESEYGKDTIDDSIERFLEADREVYEQTVREHEERVRELSATSPGMDEVGRSTTAGMQEVGQCQEQLPRQGLFPTIPCTPSIPGGRMPEPK